MTNLQDWSDIIARQGEESRKRLTETLQVMTDLLPENVKQLPGYSPVELFDLYDQTLSGSQGDMRIQAVLMTWKGHIRDEILRRMK